MTNQSDHTLLTLQSFKECRNRFNSELAAKTYSTRHLSSRKGKRELHCIKQALCDLTRNSLILDLPCGTGRLSYFIHRLGFRVIGADYSLHMINYAKKNPDLFASQAQRNNQISFEQQDVMALNYPDNTFDAVVCNRLFHHYPTPELRRMILKGLAQISKGPLIISYFNSYSLSACLSRLKNIARSKKYNDRMPISYHVFKQDIQMCGLKIDATYYTHFGFSPQTYVKLSKV